MSIEAPDDEAVIFREVDGEILALDTRSNQIHQLNRTASLIWRMCRHGATAEEIAAELVDGFHVDDMTARRDIARTVERLRALNLLK